MDGSLLESRATNASSGVYPVSAGLSMPSGGGVRRGCGGGAGREGLGLCWRRMSPLSSQIAGRDRNILVVRLPAMVTDEQVAIIQDEVRSRLPRQAGAGLIFDMGAVELINSIGITCILQVEEHCRKSSAAFLLAAVPAAIAQFLRQLKLDKRFQSRPTAEDAIAALDVATR